MGDAKHAADVLIVLAGKAGVLGAFLAEQNAPALWSEGAPEPLGGQLDFPNNTLHLSKIGSCRDLTHQLGRTICCARGGLCRGGPPLPVVETFGLRGAQVRGE